MTKVKIGIVGHGFVGQATDFGFSTNTEKFVVDPKYKTNLDNLKDFSPEFIFICLPTPMLNDGNQDVSLVEENLLDINARFKKSILILKSTILPSFFKKNKSELSNVVYNPEFLREKYAEEDFINSKMIILAGDQSLSKKVADLYENNSICKYKNFLFTDFMSASLVKYSINSFLATKVLFFNQIKDIFETFEGNSSWDEFTNMISQDVRIGQSHMSVPGPDGKKGFGGACFTKDTAALLKYSQEINKDFKLLDEVIRLNNGIRSNYDSLDDREKDQNVNYEFNK